METNYSGGSASSIAVRTEAIHAAATAWQETHQNIIAVESAVPGVIRNAAAAAGAAALRQALDEVAADAHIEGQVDAEATRLMATALSRGAGGYQTADGSAVNAVCSAAGGNAAYSGLSDTAAVRLPAE